MDNARSLAVRSLIETLEHGAYSNLELKRTLGRSDLSVGGRALYKQLYFGALERMRLLDFCIAQVSKMKLSKMSPLILNTLRVGAYGLYFTDFPTAKTVNETVAILRKKAPNATGLVNAILRNLPPLPDDLAPAVRYSVSDEIYTLLHQTLGEQTDAFLEQALTPAPITARVNTCRTTAQDLIHTLSEQGVTAQETDQPNALHLSLSSALENLPAYRDGLFHLQGLSSQSAVALLDPKPNEVMLDLCCAPGGKAFTAAQYMQDRGHIYGFDLHEHRVELIRAGAARLGLSCITAATADATAPLDVPQADVILADVPCSALGQLSRRPELRYRNPDTAALTKTQAAILENAARYLKAGGRLLYSTCTLNMEENRGVRDRFLSDHPEFTAVSEVMPTDPHDGFYMTLLKKERS